MRTLNGLLVIAVAMVAACAPSSTLNKGSGAEGILRVTNSTRESVQVFMTTQSGETFLRLVQPGNSESFHVPGKQPGDAISLLAKTQSGREYTSREAITLSANSCTRNYGAPPATPGCEWMLP